MDERLVSLYLMKYVYSIADHSVFYLISWLAQIYVTASSHFPEIVNMDHKYSRALALSFKAITLFMPLSVSRLSV
jgi:hypothetical protein